MRFYVAFLLLQRVFKGTLPPSKKFMNWHESDVARFRKSENEYLPNFIEKYSPVFKILDFYFCLLFWDLRCF